MPKQTTKSSNSLAAQLAAKNARKNSRHKEAEVPKGGGSLPPGIEGGIAKVRQIQFKTIKQGDNAGKLMFYVDGTCFEPKSFSYTPTGQDRNTTVKTEGQLVQLKSTVLSEGQYRDGTEYTFEDQWERVENTLKLLGIPTEDIDDDELQEVVEAWPEENDVFFSFRTWAGEATKEYPNPRTNVVLLGLAEGYEAEVVDDIQEELDEEAAVADEEEEEEPEPEPKKKPGRKPGRKAAAKSEKKPAKKAAVKEPAEPDYVDMGVRADGGDEDAEQELIAEAEKNGLDVEDFKTWKSCGEAVTDALRAGDADEPAPEEEEAPDEEPEGSEDEQAPKKAAAKSEAPEPTGDPNDEDDWQPEMEDTYIYVGGEENVEIEVVKVNKRSKKVDAKEVGNEEEVHKGISWKDLRDA